MSKLRSTRRGTSKSCGSFRTMRTKLSPTSACNRFRRRIFLRFHPTWSRLCPMAECRWTFTLRLTQTNDRTPGPATDRDIPNDGELFHQGRPLHVAAPRRLDRHGRDHRFERADFAGEKSFATRD